MSTVLRGARLPVKTGRDVVEFISSLESDRRIARSIVLVNEAHVAALFKARVIDEKDARRLLVKLRKLENLFPKHMTGEDFHLYVEEELTKRLGPELGGKLHTGKSRNDQVATAIRMSLRESLLELSTSLLSLIDRLLTRAERYADTFFVGYTHLQPAQPITYGHYLVSVADPLLRDTDRILETYRRVNRSPMGSAALAGSSYNLDRRDLAKLLGFNGLVENSLDAVGSRDFLLETLAVCSIIASNLSRIAQDTIFYSSSDVNLLELSPDFSSTSSIMPQKKNPDPLEIVRARCATVTGNYTTGAGIMHALPSGYNLDFQELTPLVWNSIDTLRSCLSIMTGVIGHTRPVRDIAERHQVQFTVATELANTLAVETQRPFRDAYRWLGQAVRLAIQDHRTLRQLTREEWQQIANLELDQRTFRTIQRVADPTSHPRLYRTQGSPRPDEVERMITSRRRSVQKGLRAVHMLRQSLDLFGKVTIPASRGRHVRKNRHSRHKIALRLSSRPKIRPEPSPISN